MKKCDKCNIVFNLDERSRCLYCNSLLLLVELGEGAKYEDNYSREGFASDDTVILKIIEDRRQVAQDRRFYVIGSYFCTRALHFMYCFSRNEMKRGRTFRRVLVQPLNMGSFLIIPWVVFDLIDSLWIRLVYNAYCDQCGWKFQKISSQGSHDPKECAYNQEYAAVVNDILNGAIVQTESGYREKAAVKISRGERSAYLDLSTERNFFSWLLDVTCVWFSISLIIVFIVMLVFPPLGKMIFGLEDVLPLELR